MSGKKYTPKIEESSSPRDNWSQQNEPLVSFAGLQNTGSLILSSADYRIEDVKL